MKHARHNNLVPRQRSAPPEEMDQSWLSRLTERAPQSRLRLGLRAATLAVGLCTAVAGIGYSTHQEAVNQTVANAWEQGRETGMSLAKDGLESVLNPAVLKILGTDQYYPDEFTFNGYTCPNPNVVDPDRWPEDARAVCATELP